MAQPPVIYPANTTPPKKGLNYVWNWLGSSLKSFATALSPYLTSGGVIVTNYPEVVALMSSGSLVKGATYKIGGFNKNMPVGPLNPNGYLPEVLYDDGTNSGITIIMQALTGSELATSGYGEFYNPKYGDETTYNNTDGTGLYRIWDGDNPVAVPAYQVDDVVFWGGYAWKNLLGNVGSDIDILNLDPVEWEKLPYSNSTWYELVIDEIKVDWNFGILIERYNPENQVRVAFNADEYYWNGLYTNVQCSPISVMAWGLYSKYAEGLTASYYGIGSVEVINSYCETVSFKGNIFGYNKLFDYSFVYNNYFGKDSYVKSNTLDGSQMYSNTLNNNSSINTNTLDNNSYIYINTLDVSQIYDNTLDGSSIYNNTLIASTFDFSSSGSLVTYTIQKNYSNNATVTANISAATHILASYTKQIFTRADGTARLSYFDNTDTLQVVAVNA